MKFCQEIKKEKVFEFAMNLIKSSKKNINMTMDLKEVEFLFYALTSEERVFDPAIVCNKEG